MAGRSSPPGLGVTRATALALAAAAISRNVADITGLCLLLDDAGFGRLAAALRLRLGERPAAVSGAPRPDAARWAEAANRAVRR
jgi:hypothetical protein